LQAAGRVAPQVLSAHTATPPSVTSPRSAALKLEHVNLFPNQAAASCTEPSFFLSFLLSHLLKIQDGLFISKERAYINRQNYV
jgi:hypothetical protein